MRIRHRRHRAIVLLFLISYNSRHLSGETACRDSPPDATQTLNIYLPFSLAPGLDWRELDRFVLLLHAKVTGYMRENWRFEWVRDRSATYNERHSARHGSDHTRSIQDSRAANSTSSATLGSILKDMRN